MIYGLILHYQNDSWELIANTVASSQSVLLVLFTPCLAGLAAAMMSISLGHSSEKGEHKKKEIERTRALKQVNSNLQSNTSETVPKCTGTAL